MRGAPVVRFESCAHGARMWQPKNLMRESRNPQERAFSFRRALVGRLDICARGARILQNKYLGQGSALEIPEKETLMTTNLR